jgi:hypothetical protein
MWLYAGAMAFVVVRTYNALHAFARGEQFLLDDLMRSRSRLWPLVIGSTLLFVIFVWTDAIPLLRGPEEWGWTLRILTQPVWRLLLPLALLALYAIVAARWIVTFPIDSTRPTRRAEWGFLIFLTWLR